MGGGEEMYLMCFKSRSFRMWLGLVFFFSFFNLKPVVKRSLL